MMNVTSRAGGGGRAIVAAACFQLIARAEHE